MLYNQLRGNTRNRPESSGGVVLRNVSRMGLLLVSQDRSCKHGGRRCATISWIITGTIA